MCNDTIMRVTFLETADADGAKCIVYLFKGVLAEIIAFYIGMYRQYK